MTPLGTPIDRNGVLVWSGTSRPLSSHELRMRERCGNLWLALAGGVYRLAMNLRSIADWEVRHGAALLSLHGFDQPLAGTTRLWRERVVPTHAQSLDLIFSAIVCGGAVAIDGKAVPVTPTEATALVEKHLVRLPVEALVPTVAAILDHVAFGSVPTPEEQDAFTIPASANPPVPAWAMAA